MRRRLVAIALLTLAALTAQARAAAADERFVLIVSGVSGSDKIAATQDKWVADLTAALRGPLAIPADHIVTLTESAAGAAASTREGVTAAFARLKQRVTAHDSLMVVLIGHGTAVGTVAKFNLVGPDMDTLEWKHLIDGIAGRIIFVNTTSASFPFVQDLSGKNRIIISATDSVAQKYDTMFPQYFIEALNNVAAADSDKNGRLSVWEAFAYASQAVKQAFAQKGTMVTERAVLDDNGDGVGREATASGSDGVLAKTTFLDAEPASTASNPAAAALDRQRVTLEAQIEELKGRKAQMAAADYDAQLEKLAIELARISAQIRSTTPPPPPK
jgi:hypothetical protein